MDRVKPPDIRLVEKLGRFDKPYWSVADLQKILGYKSRRTLLVTLHRLAAQGVLKRIRRGIYRVSMRSADTAVLANLLYRPSYLSFESVLARYGILSQIPYTVTLATTRRSKKTTLEGTAVEYRQLRPDLFFGYRIEKGLEIAEPEKALLDALYLVKRGRLSLPLEELNLSVLSSGKLKSYKARFPGYVQDALAALQ
ncbi:MAG: type IV toxin-antitoxin system AbiEi family antitoxin domain-containing protein [Candidatus Aminicenantes bacterium]|nr:type IV toxin-antitoxin system AbiEi family antitoxin domain-containing protein [Candidatus Aminicenantes bacterium]